MKRAKFCKCFNSLKLLNILEFNPDILCSKIWIVEEANYSMEKIFLVEPKYSK